MPDVSRYFDHAATTPVRPEVWEAMGEYAVERFGNPNSLHQFGLEAKEALERARSVVAAFIGARDKEVFFTGTGTEANNLAVIGAARRLRRLGRGSHLITSAVEHPSVRKAMQSLEKEGFRVTQVPVDRFGRVDPEDVRRAMEPDTVLVSIMHANNVVGTVQPVEEIGAFTRERGIWFHVDAVQSFGKIPVDVERFRADLLTINAHKIGGPKGIAALYIRKGVRLDPLVYGGGQERGMRPGTQNVAGIVGFAKAVELSGAARPAETRRLTALRRRLENRLRHLVPELRINGHPDFVLPTVLNIGVPRIEGQALMLELDRLGFAVSSGSACSSTDHEPSYVLLAMGQSREEALESLRISLGWTTGEAAVDALADAVAQAARRWKDSSALPVD